MKYFNHFTDAHAGLSMRLALRDHGHAGYAIYFILMELCIAKFEKSIYEDATEDHCKFDFALGWVCRCSATTPSKLRVMLEYYQSALLLRFDIDGDTVHIEVPKLLEYMSKNFKTARRRKNTATLEENRIEEEENRIEEEKPPRKRSEFDLVSIYEKYPRRIGKQKGLQKAKAQIKTQEDYDALTLSVANYSSYCRSRATEEKYIKHFDSFMTSWRDWTQSDTGTTQIMPAAKKKTLEDYYTPEEKQAIADRKAEREREDNEFTGGT